MSVVALFDLSGMKAFVAPPKRGIDYGMAVAEAAPGIGFNASAPGSIDTDNTKAPRSVLGNNQGNNPARSKSILDRNSASRPGGGKEFAGGEVDLTSPASNYMHRSIRTINGEWMGQ